MAEEAVKNMDEMGRFAQKAGVTVEMFSSLAYGANLLDIGAEQLSKAFKGLSKNISEAETYGTPTAQMFRDMSISVRDANGDLLSSEQILLQIADKFADTADGANKTELAVKLFGRAGQDMIPFLNQGAKGLKEMQEEAVIFHQVFSGETTASAKEFTEDLKKIKLAIQGIVNGVVVEFLPAAAKMLSAFVDWIKTSGVLEFAINSLIDLFKVLRYSIELVMNAGEALWDIFKGLGEGIADIFAAAKTTIESLAKAAGSMFAAVEEMFKGNWTNARSMADNALETLKTDFNVWKNDVVAIGKDTANGFANAFKLLAKVPGAPDLFQGQTPEAYGPPPPPKPPLIESPSYDSEKNLLPSGNTMAAYKLDQDMMLQTQKMLLDANATKMTLADQEKMMLSVKMQEEDEAYNKRLEQITNLRLEDGENYALVESAYAEHAARMKKISNDMSKQTLDSHLKMYDGVASILGSFASLAQTFGKKGFLAYQAFSIGQAIISTATGAARALADFPWPISAVMAAAVSAAGAAQIATIVSQKPPQAHAGASMIPEDATYLLKEGERVLAPQQNQDLTQFLSNGGGGPMVFDFTFDGQVFGRAISHWARGGHVEIPVRAIV